MEANLIDRDIAEDYFGCSDWEILAKETLREVPLVDAVPVVRCRDCKHYQHYGKTSLLENGKNVKAGWCYRRIRFDEECRMPADGFCSYGQRKIETVLPKSDAKDESLEV